LYVLLLLIHISTVGRCVLCVTYTLSSQSDNELVAMRDIKKGEEIAYDYALTECHEAFRLNCRCGTAKVA
jgi:SET domain-containing protein